MGVASRDTCPSGRTRSLDCMVPASQLNQSLWSISLSALDDFIAAGAPADH